MFTCTHLQVAITGPVEHVVNSAAGHGDQHQISARLPPFVVIVMRQAGAELFGNVWRQRPISGQFFGFQGVMKGLDSNSRDEL